MDNTEIIQALKDGFQAGKTDGAASADPTKTLGRAPTLDPNAGHSVVYNSYWKQGYSMGIAYGIADYNAHHAKNPIEQNGFEAQRIKWQNQFDKILASFATVRMLSPCAGLEDGWKAGVAAGSRISILPTDTVISDPLEVLTNDNIPNDITYHEPAGHNAAKDRDIPSDAPDDYKQSRKTGFNLGSQYSYYQGLGNASAALAAKKDYERALRTYGCVSTDGTYCDGLKDGLDAGLEDGQSIPKAERGLQHPEKRSIPGKTEHYYWGRTSGYAAGVTLAIKFALYNETKDVTEKERILRQAQAVWQEYLSLRGRNKCDGDNSNPPLANLPMPLFNLDYVP